MYLDDLLLLSDAQTVTSSSNSTNVIDSLAAGGPVGEAMFLHMLIDTAFAGSTNSSVTLALQVSSDNSTFSTIGSLAIPIASLTENAAFNISLPPTGLLRYVRAYYTVAGGGLTAGAVTTSLAKDVNVSLNRAE